MIHLDTQVAIWLFVRKHRLLSNAARRLLERETSLISPMVVFEYEILIELERVREPADVFVADLAERHGVDLSVASFQGIVARARSFAWTRDPFDRLIVANAMADGARLLTADAMILDNFKDAVW